MTLLETDLITYLNKKLDVETNSKSEYLVKYILKSFTDQIDYIAGLRNKDASLVFADLEKANNANIEAENVDGSNVLHSSSQGSVVGAKHYNEDQVNQLMYKHKAILSDEEQLLSVRKDFEKVLKSKFSETWYPRAKRASIKKKSQTSLSSYVNKFKTASK